MNELSGRSNNPLMSAGFARVYEKAAHRITYPIAVAAIELVGGIVRGQRVIDIAAGADALSVPAAERGASVLSVDVAPGMVDLLVERLRQYPACEARLMDGQKLDLDDGAFDLAFSIFGVILFATGDGVWLSRRGSSDQEV